jgi:hypothetical protein
VPGVIITQHSGSGKANQYFLRGFNLDHGTDLRTTVDDIPVNMPSHGHGQGYSDLNFLIPELVDTVRYKKGPYYAIANALSAGISADGLGPWFGSLRLRYFGPRPLIEDDSVRSKASSLLTFRIGHKFPNGFAIAVDVFNLLGNEVSDVDYY